MHTFDQALHTVNEQWEEDKHREKRQFPNWHGFATTGETPGSTLALFVNKNIPTEEEANLRASFSEISDALNPEIVKTKMYRMAAGRVEADSGPIRPGDFIHATNPICTDDAHQPCDGTIGAFFKKSGADQPIWLLTCLHVLHALLNDDDKCGRKAEVESNGDTISDGTIIFNPLNPEPAVNSVDMGLAELKQGVNASALYVGLTLKSTTPFRPPADNLVQKRGATSRVTCGKIMNYSNTAVEVLACKGSRKFLFQDLIIIQSLVGLPDFAEEGDSGSLVVSDGKPVGLLLAITDEDDSSLVSGLAIPWDNVISAVKGLFAFPVEMMLEPSTQTSDPCRGKKELTGAAVQ